MLTPCLYLKAHHKDHRMHTLYDSETFTVTHMLANAQSQNMSPEAASGPGNTALSDVKTDQYPQGVPMLARHGFEIVDKRSGKEVYLDGSWAELFQQHIVAWQVNMPTQEEVEDTLSQYAELAQTPVLVH
jgi:hypothetical protein